MLDNNTGSTVGLSLEIRLLKLKDHMFNNQQAVKKFDKERFDLEGPGSIIFISICDTKKRAAIYVGTGKTMEKAWISATENIYASESLKKMDVRWIKADIVDYVESINIDELNNRIKSKHSNFYRKGIAFDANFEVSLLEAELNSNKIINYKEDRINEERLIKYLKRYRNLKIDKVPDKLYEFSTTGFFCDEEGTVYDLYTDDLNHGRRKKEIITSNDIISVLRSSSNYLVNNMDSNGRFIYGYFPAFDKEILNYNILRHAGTLWSLLLCYMVLQDPILLDSLNRGINYLIQDGLVFKDHKTAYILERKSDEIKLGGNAITIILLVSYMEKFKTDEFLNIAICLGNGILDLIDKENGKYFHILDYPGFTRKQEKRTVYYDGESTFALCKLYKITGDEKWIGAARKSIEYFIENNYTKYIDHWVAYSVNELTKHVPKREYFEFGLRNVNDNLEWIYNRPTTYHIYSELLLQTYEIYKRVEVLDPELISSMEFDLERFIQVINYRLAYSFNAFFYPEYAMYFKNPQRILNSFFIRQDSFRVRIDDIQHFIGGLYQYYIHLNSINDTLKK